MMTYRKRKKPNAQRKIPSKSDWIYLSEKKKNREAERSDELVAVNDHQTQKIDNVMFSEKELNGIEVLKKGENYIEVDCGCTNTKVGDSAGKFRIYSSGKLRISCNCYPGCPGEDLTPYQFERHSLCTGASNWQARIWVFVGEKKVILKKTKLLKYHMGSASDPSHRIRPVQYKAVHREEKMTCTACGKERRFARRTKDGCKQYHLASLASETWTCSDHPKGLTCEVGEDRGCKKKLTGCQKNALCKGCVSCVCFGCNMCRFEDCDCRSCVDFIQNSEPKD